MPTTTLPAGAHYATDGDDDCHRVVFGRDLCGGAPIVKASCTLMPSGAIADDPAEEGPRVHVMLDPGGLTVDAARELAAAITAAADVAEQWRVQAADALSGDYGRQWGC